MAIILVLIAAVMVLLLCEWYRNMKKSPPGPWGIPIFGVLFQMVPQNPMKSFREWRDRYGPLVSARIGSKLVIILNDYDVTREAFEKQGDVFSGRMKDFYPLTVFDGLGLTMQDGHKWQVIRRFSQSAMRDMGMGKLSMDYKILEETEALMKSLENDPGIGKPFVPAFSNATSNVVANIIFGTRFQYDDPDFIKFIDDVNCGFQFRRILRLASYIPLMRYLPSVKKALESQRQLNYAAHAFVKKLVAERKQMFEPNDKPQDFLNCLLLEADSSDENRAIYYEQWENGKTDCFILTLMNLFAAGTETTSTTLKWIFALLVKYPEHQHRMFEEVKSVVGLERPPSYEDFKDMHFFSAFVYETMRYATVATTTIPHVTTADTNLRGYYIPEGSVVFSSLNCVHTDEKYFKEPFEFIPERFLKANGEANHRMRGFMPFSIGKRMCLGESLAKREVFLFTACFLQKFEFLPASPDKLPSCKECLGLTIYPEPYEMILKAR